MKTKSFLLSSLLSYAIGSTALSAQVNQPKQTHQLNSSFSEYFTLNDNSTSIDYNPYSLFVTAYSEKVPQQSPTINNFKLEVSEIRTLIDKFKNYSFLYHQGIAIERINKINPLHFEQIVEGIQTKQFPLELLLEEEPVLTYPIKSAIYSNDFTTDKEKIQDYLKMTINTKMKSFRVDAEYDERADQICTIDDEIFLTNLKRYVDYFNEDKNWKDIDALFEETSDSLRLERGGMIIDKEGMPEFIEIGNLTKELDTYYNGAIRFYASRLGDLHIHTDDGVTDIKIVTGPSGWVGSTRGDLAVLEHFNDINPYTINVVVSEMGPHKYNVDAYFIQKKYITKHLENIITVIDLGIYSVEK